MCMPMSNINCSISAHMSLEFGFLFPLNLLTLLETMRWLQSYLGYDGFRFDMVKGFEPKYVKFFLQQVHPWQYAVGEYFNGNTDYVTNYIKLTGETSDAFDFPLRFILDRAIQSDNYQQMLEGIHPPGVLGQMSWKAATFLDNHDTTHMPFGNGDLDLIIKGYVYILLHPGTPFIYWDHWIHPHLRSKLIELIQLRKSIQQQQNEHFYVDKHQQHLYYVYLGTKEQPCKGYLGYLALKLGSGDSWNPYGSGWTLKTHGNRYAIWQHDESPFWVDPFIILILYFLNGPFDLLIQFDPTFVEKISRNDAFGHI